jgi:two-component system LytT family response regulator
MSEVLSCIIVDDEPRSRKVLAQMIHDFCPPLNILGMAASVDEAVALTKKEKPDVIFLDIEMPGGSGFTLFDKLDASLYRIVFTTAYDQYALHAIKVSAFDYLLKPINIQELVTTVEKLNQNYTTVSEPNIEMFRNNIRNFGKTDGKLALPGLSGIEFVSTETINFISAALNNSVIFTTGNERIVVYIPLKDLENMLPRKMFFRSHKSHIINIKHLKRVHTRNGYYAEMHNGEKVEVSVRKYPELKSLF